MSLFKKVKSAPCLILSILLVITCLLSACTEGGIDVGGADYSIVCENDSFTVYVGTHYEDVVRTVLQGVYCDGKSDAVINVRILAKGNGKEITGGTLSMEGEYIIEYSCDIKGVKAAHASLTVKLDDKTAPVIEGAADKVVILGSTVSYREGITVSDDIDTDVQLTIDTSKVDLTALGAYPLTYTATDDSGNSVSVTVTITVVEGENNGEFNDGNACTEEEFNGLCDQILSEILTDGMSDYEKAEAIYDRVNKIKYVNVPGEYPYWTSAAYIGLTTGRGDCFYYFAASKALLSAAGIPNFDLERFGGETDHYWNLAFVNGGWYHFDACPTSKNYPFRCFLKTDEEVREYTELRAPGKPNYYTYDPSTCPYEIVQSRS